MVSAVGASDRRNEADEESADDGLPHGGQARRRQWSRQASPGFSPIRSIGLGEAQVLKVGAGDTRQQRVAVQPGPRAAFEVVEAEFLLHLLMGARSCGRPTT